MYKDEGKVQGMRQKHSMGLIKSKIFFLKMCEIKIIILQYLINLSETINLLFCISFSHVYTRTIS